jgi:hypothetical protein
MNVRRCLSVALVLTGLLLIVGGGCDSSARNPKVEGNKMELKPLPPPGAPGGGQKSKAGPSPQ